MALAFRCDSPAEVDAVYARMTKDGHAGAPRAVRRVLGPALRDAGHDPDGNAVDLSRRCSADDRRGRFHDPTHAICRMLARARLTAGFGSRGRRTGARASAELSGPAGRRPACARRGTGAAGRRSRTRRPPAPAGTPSSQQGQRPAQPQDAGQRLRAVAEEVAAGRCRWRAVRPDGSPRVVRHRWPAASGLAIAAARGSGPPAVAQSRVGDPVSRSPPPPVGHALGDLAHGRGRPERVERDPLVGQLGGRDAEHRRAGAGREAQADDRSPASARPGRRWCRGRRSISPVRLDQIRSVQPSGRMRETVEAGTTRRHSTAPVRGAACST